MSDLNAYSGSSAPSPSSVGARIDLIRSPDPVPANELLAACDFILAHARSQLDVSMADLLKKALLSEPRHQPSQSLGAEDHLESEKGSSLSEARRMSLDVSISEVTLLECA